MAFFAYAPPKNLRQIDVTRLSRMIQIYVTKLVTIAAAE